MPFPINLQSVFLREQSIELFVPDATFIREAYEKGAISFPYWSQVWPAAKALAEFLLQHPPYTSEKKVLELGGGLGLPSLVAARNAQRVLCTDVAPEAIEIVKRSAAHLRLQNFVADILDWQHIPQTLEADVLLLSDINYEPSAFATMQKVVASFLAKGTIILLSTPQRLMAKDFVAPLLRHCTLQEEIAVRQQEKQVAVTVMVLGREAVSCEL